MVGCNQRIVEKDLNPRIVAAPIDELTAPAILISPRKLERHGAVETAHRARGLISMVVRRLAERLREPQQHRSDSLWIHGGRSPA